MPASAKLPRSQGERLLPLLSLWPLPPLPVLREGASSFPSPNYNLYSLFNRSLLNMSSRLLVGIEERGQNSCLCPGGMPSRIFRPSASYVVVLPPWLINS